MANLVNGRVNQKLRTRNALVEVAARLIAERRTFTVADVADEAKVGRTTAYRYFPNLDVLIGHAALWALTGAEDIQIAKAREHVGSYSERLEAIVDFSDSSISKHEAEYRTMLKLSLEDKSGEVGALPRRSGLRSQHLAEALSGLEAELGADRFRMVCAGLSLFIGIEATVVLRDVCMLSKEDARAVKFWGAKAMLEAAAKAPRPAQTVQTRRVVHSAVSRENREAEVTHQYPGD